jgi:glycosyltransferase involved in cell wall biosynthesis
VHVHIPTPGDHYSAETGSATITVIYEISREHEREPDRRSFVIVSAGTRHDYQAGTVVEVAGPPGLPSHKASLVDSIVGRAGLERPARIKAYRPACHAVPDDATWVFLHNAVPPLSEMAKNRPDVARALWVHNELFRTYGRREMRRCLGSADRVLCCSHFIADRIAARAPSAADSVRVVHNGVDIERFHPRDDGATDEVPVVLFVGRVVAEKGPDLLLRAATRIISKKRRFRVRIVGSRGFAVDLPLSPYEEELRHLAAPLGPDVEFVPFVARAAIPDLYRSASVFCVPANWDEPFGLTTLEGMASGLAVVAAPRGGIPEVGADSVYYVDPTDTDQLAGALADLLDDPLSRAQLGARARARAEYLSWANQYQRLREALSAKRG